MRFLAVVRIGCDDLGGSSYDEVGVPAFTRLGVAVSSSIQEKSWLICLFLSQLDLVTLCKVNCIVYSISVIPVCGGFM